MPGLNEAATRSKLIDPKLKACGWEILPFDPTKQTKGFNRCALTEYPTENGPADYALVVGGRVLAIVEAKKLTLGPQNVLTQAERYARSLLDSHFNFSGLRAPFLYSTNGEIIWFHDVRHPMNRSRRVAGFHTPDALEEMLSKDFEGACKELLATPNQHQRLYPFQRDANEGMERAIAARKREMLVAMATGTGKTFTLVNEIYRLIKAGVAKRVLFLVDRRALAAQAVRAFASFDAEPNQKFNQIYEVYSQRFFRDDLDEDEKFDPKVLPSSYLLSPNLGLAFVYVCTIQRMTINLFGRNAVFATGDEEVDEDADKLDIPIHAFDLIVADECHRGYTESNLQRAHERCYHKALADIISMVKHAARETEQLLTGEERAALAIQRVAQGRYLAPEQQQWFDWIKAHLAVNLSIEKDDFDLSPILMRHGGWGQANRAFQGQLEGLIQKLNEAVAA